MYKSIVVGTDGSSTARQAVVHAAKLAAQNDAELHIVHAFQPPDVAVLADTAAIPMNPVEWRKETEAHAERVCADAVLEAQELGAKAESHAVPGGAAEALIQVAETVGADLLVVGNRGMSGVKRFFLGSVPNTVSHHSPCNLLILRTT
jgi:nucleotide-binding universal stress UspA family protein